jgi:glycosyltransferase involved in cell wall biosynthesis
MDKNNPTVSVVIPTYNRAHLIGRSIRSVLSQTYQDFEIIVVDDASTDNTEEVLRSLGNERIRYIRQEQNKGANAARNTGIKAGRGKYIAFQDSDDIWLPDKLEKQMNVFKTALPNVGVVYTGCIRVFGNNIYYFPSSQITKKDGDIHQQLLIRNFVGTQSIMAPREYLEKVGMFDENFPRLQDWELVIRLSKYYKFKFIDEPLLISPYTDDSISADKDALIAALKLFIEKYFEELKKNITHLANLYYLLGSTFNSIGDFNNARVHYIKAFKTYPFHYRSLLHIILSLFGEELYYNILKYFQKNMA